MVKAILGFDFAAGVAGAAGRQWLDEVHAPALLAGPGLDRVVLNEVIGPVRGEALFDGIAELHFRDRAAHERHLTWSRAGPNALCRARARWIDPRFHVLTDEVDADRATLPATAAERGRRGPSAHPWPGVKAILGYDIVPGVTREAYEDWLWTVHAPDLLANPHLERIVFNTVIRPLTGTRGYYRVAELHHRDMAAYRRYRAWFEEHPIPPERGPAGRTDFKFYVLARVRVVERRAHG